MSNLYVVATPIGNLGDITHRALEILKTVDLIAAEDTRHSKKLLQHFAIKTPLWALHEHNEQHKIADLLDLLQQGKEIALISDAGTPLISDPGYRLVKAVREAGFRTVPIPGCCAAIAALSAAGLPSDRFIFEGFLPAKSSARQQRLQQLFAESRTLIFYEAPHRILDFLQDVISIFGAEREAVLARELSKTFETILDGKLSDLLARLEKDDNQRKGEFVVLIKGIDADMKSDHTESLRLLTLLLEELPLKQAVNLAVKITGEKKNSLYQQALKLIMPPESA